MKRSVTTTSAGDRRCDSIPAFPFATATTS
jgi:hypothetical protein